jgi:Stress responsive A/B Barrel Domain
MKLRHVVLFGFANSVSATTIAEIVRRFAELKTLVPGVDEFEWGENASPEGLDRGHSHAFLLTFGGSEARDAYLVHPDHVAFAEWVGPFVSTVTVIDYEVDGAV